MQESPIIDISRYILGTFPYELKEGLLEKASQKATQIVLRDWPGGLHDPILSLNAYGIALLEVSKGAIRLNQVAMNVHDSEKLSRRLIIETKTKKRGSYHPSFFIRNSLPLKLFGFVGYSEGLFTVNDGNGRSITMTIPEVMKRFILPDYIIPGYTDEVVIGYSFSWRPTRR